MAFYFSFSFFFAYHCLLSVLLQGRGPHSNTVNTPLLLLLLNPLTPFLSLPFPSPPRPLLPLCSVDHSFRPVTKLIHYSHIPTMPVSVNDPFLLASFSSTTHHHQQQQAVSCSPEERDTTPANYEEDSGLLVVAVQGEGVQLYNVSRKSSCLADNREQKQRRRCC